MKRSLKQLEDVDSATTENPQKKQKLISDKKASIFNGNNNDKNASSNECKYEIGSCVQRLLQIYVRKLLNKHCNMNVKTAFRRLFDYNFYLQYLSIIVYVSSKSIETDHSCNNQDTTKDNSNDNNNDDNIYNNNNNNNHNNNIRKLYITGNNPNSRRNININSKTELFIRNLGQLWNVPNIMIDESLKGGNLINEFLVTIGKFWNENIKPDSSETQIITCINSLKNCLIGHCIIAVTLNKNIDINVKRKHFISNTFQDTVAIALNNSNSDENTYASSKNDENLKLELERYFELKSILNKYDQVKQLAIRLGLRSECVKHYVDILRVEKELALKLHVKYL